MQRALPGAKPTFRSHLALRFGRAAKRKANRLLLPANGAGARPQTRHEFALI